MGTPEKTTIEVKMPRYDQTKSKIVYDVREVAITQWEKYKNMPDSQRPTIWRGVREGEIEENQAIESSLVASLKDENEVLKAKIKSLESRLEDLVNYQDKINLLPTPETKGKPGPKPKQQLVVEPSQEPEIN